MRLSDILRRLLPLGLQVRSETEKLVSTSLYLGDRYIITTGRSKIDLRYSSRGLEVLIASPGAVRRNWEGLSNKQSKEVKIAKRQTTLP